MTFTMFVLFSIAISTFSSCSCGITDTVSEVQTTELLNQLENLQPTVRSLLALLSEQDAQEQLADLISSLTDIINEETKCSDTKALAEPLVSLLCNFTADPTSIVKLAFKFYGFILQLVVCQLSNFLPPEDLQKFVGPFISNIGTNPLNTGSLVDG